MEEEKKEMKQTPKVEEKKATTNKVTTQTKKEDVKKEVKKQEPSKTANKKFDTAKVPNKKSNKNMILISVVAIMIAIIAIVIAITFMKDSPKKVLESTLTDLKTGAYAQEMLAGLFHGEDNFNTEAQKLLFEKLEWKILTVKEEGDKASIEVEITNKDFKTIMGNYMQKALKVAFSGQTVNEEEMSNYLMEELRNEQVQTVTANQTITLEKQDGKWQITEDEQFVNSVLPGLYEAISAFN